MPAGRACRQGRRGTEPVEDSAAIAGLFATACLAATLARTLAGALAGALTIAVGMLALVMSGLARALALQLAAADRAIAVKIQAGEALGMLALQTFEALVDPLMQGSAGFAALGLAQLAVAVAVEMLEEPLSELAALAARTVAARTVAARTVALAAMLTTLPGLLGLLTLRIAELTVAVGIEAFAESLAQAFADLATMLLHMRLGGGLLALVELAVAIVVEALDQTLPQCVAGVVLAVMVALVPVALVPVTIAMLLAMSLARAVLPELGPGGSALSLVERAVAVCVEARQQLAADHGR